MPSRVGLYCSMYLDSIISEILLLLQNIGIPRVGTSRESAPQAGQRGGVCWHHRRLVCRQQLSQPFCDFQSSRTLQSPADITGGCMGQKDSRHALANFCQGFWKDYIPSGRWPKRSKDMWEVFSALQPNPYR